jgi:hypothetical protein
MITILMYVIWLGALIVLWLGSAYLRLGVKLRMRAVSDYGLVIVGLALCLVLFPIVLRTNPTYIVAIAVIISLLSAVLIRLKQAHQIDAFLTKQGITTKQLLLMRY